MALKPQKLDNLITRLGASPHVENLGKTKLWKLIYFIDAKHLREFGETLTGSDYIKYDHGPVPSRGDKRLKSLEGKGSIKITPVDYGSYKQNHITSKSEPSGNGFTESELEVINKICEKFGRDTATYLSEVSHKEPAWINAKKMDKLSEDLMYYGASEEEEGL